jgi:hypothetical protein
MVGTDAVCGRGFAARPDAGEEEHAALVPRPDARKGLLFVRDDRVVAALDVDNHEGALVSGPSTGRTRCS